MVAAEVDLVPRSGFNNFPDRLGLPRFIPMIAVSGTDVQGGSIPIRGVYLHSVSRSAAAVLANLVREFLNVDRLFEVAGEAVGQEPGDASL